MKREYIIYLIWEYAFFLLTVLTVIFGIVSRRFWIRITRGKKERKAMRNRRCKNPGNRKKRSFGTGRQANSLRIISLRVFVSGLKKSFLAIIRNRQIHGIVPLQVIPDGL